MHRAGPSRGSRIGRYLTFDPLIPVGIGIVVLIWWLASLGLPPVRLPGPQRVAETAIKDLFNQPVLEFLGMRGGGFAPNIIYTVTNALVGVTLGTLIGGVLGLTSARLWMVRDLLDPVLTVLGTVPVLVAVPFLLMWFGTGYSTQVLLITFYTGSLVAIACQRAALNLPPYYEQYAASLGARPRRRFRTVVFPAAIPSILGGLRVALAASWGLEAIAELMGAPLGVGRVIVILQNVADTAGIMAVILWLGIIATAADFILAGGVRWLTRWQDVQ